MRKILSYLFVFFILCVSHKMNSQITGIKINGDTCTISPLAIQATGTSSSTYFFWNFGDPASGINDTITITGSSSPPFPSHTFSGPGIYTVCVTFQEPNLPPTTICRRFSIGLCCTGFINSADSCLQNPIAFSVITGSTTGTFNWNFGDPLSGAANSASSTNPSHVFSAAGSYTVSATATAPCGIFTVFYPLTVINCSISVPCSGTISAIDSCLANSTAFQLFSSAPVNSVSWNFGDVLSGSSNISTAIAPVHLFSSVGSYSVTAYVSSTCGNYSVAYPITIVDCVSITPCSATISVTETCLGKNTGFQINSALPIDSIQWNFGDIASAFDNTSSVDSPAHVFSQAGSFFVQATVSFSCGTITVSKSVRIVDCENIDTEIFIPTAFSPNGDGYNDRLFVRGNIKNLDFSIYSRWGELVFTTKQKDQGWDGTYKSLPMDAGVFIYKASGTDSQGNTFSKKGNVTLIR